MVGKDTKFKVMDDDDVQPFLDRINEVPRSGVASQAAEVRDLNSL